jgi:ribosomal protein L4
VVELLVDQLQEVTEQKLNKKMMKKALQSVIADKLQAGKLHVVVDTLSSLTGKTKDIYNTLKWQESSSRSCDY